MLTYFGRSRSFSRGLLLSLAASWMPSFCGRDGPFLNSDLYLGVVGDAADDVEVVAAWRVLPCSTRSTRLLFLRELVLVPLVLLPPLLLLLLLEDGDSEAPALLPLFLSPRSCFSSSSTPPKIAFKKIS